MTWQRPESQTRGTSQDPRARSATRRAAVPRAFKPPPREGSAPIGSSTRPSPAQGQTGNSLAKPSSESPGTRPLNSTFQARSPPGPAARCKLAAATRGGTDDPDGTCTGRLGGARLADGGWGTAARAPPSRPRDVAVRPTPPRPADCDPPSPPGRRSGGDRASPLPRPRSYPSFRLAL